MVSKLEICSVVLAHLNKTPIDAACIRAWEPQYSQRRGQRQIPNFCWPQLTAYLTWQHGRLLEHITGTLVVTNILPVAFSISGLLLIYSMPTVGMVQVVAPEMVTETYQRRTPSLTSTYSATLNRPLSFTRPA